MRKCVVWPLETMEYGRALSLQRKLAAERKLGDIPDQLLLVEHPDVITMGRNGQMKHVLASEDVLRASGIAFHPTDRGGDVTYHGPGQLVGYPILDLKQWRRDVVAYVRAIEQVLIDTLYDFGIKAGRIAGCTGVWVDGAKIAAIGIHLSRWITSHGFALNVTTDLTRFQYIVPCGLTKPVTSMQSLGVTADLKAVSERTAVHFGRIFDYEIWPNPAVLEESL